MLNHSAQRGSFVRHSYCSDASRYFNAVSFPYPHVTNIRALGMRSISQQAAFPLGHLPSMPDVPCTIVTTDPKMSRR